jgi:hypothetical protein
MTLIIQGIIHLACFALRHSQRELEKEIRKNKAARWVATDTTWLIGLLVGHNYLTTSNLH